MAPSIFLLCLMIGAAAAFTTCNERKCDETIRSEWEKIEYKPNEADLIRLCPRTLEYFECVEKIVKDCTGNDMEEFIESLEEFGRIMAREMWNARNIAVDICDVDSTLRRDYLENVNCYEGMVDEAYSTCRESGQSNIEAFLMHYHNVSDPENINWQERSCLEELYELACLADKLEDTCSEAARRAYLTIRYKASSHFIPKCNVEDPQSFKRAFVEHLDLVGKKEELYRFVFEKFTRK